MQSIIRKYVKYILLFSVLGAMSVNLITTSCKGEEEEKATVLLSFGPMPIPRGAELFFIGTNLDRVTSVTFPEGIVVDASGFTMQTSTSISVTVPQEAVEGYMVLTTPEGEITTKTPIGYSEPMSIGAFTPDSIKPGSELTITGDYLNLVGEVIFTDRVAVDSSEFVSQVRKELKLVVPQEAQTGKIALSNGAEEPIIVYSETELKITLPVIESIEPNPVKAGESVTIEGTSLDLIKEIVFGGEKSVNEYAINQSGTEIVVNVPVDAQDGKILFVQASGVKVESSLDLAMVEPTVSVSPESIKNRNELTVTGTNLDLINRVVFGGDSEGAIVAGGSDTEIKVTVPDGAVTGEVTFHTVNNKSVSGGQITIIAPAITGFSPASGKPNTDVVISGTDLDVVDKVVFTGDIQGTITAQSETELTVTIPVGSQTGKITLSAINGQEVMTTSDFEVLSNLPDFSFFTEAKATPGEILTLNGTKMDLIKELIFPGDIKATAYGIKTDIKVEVYVPEDVTTGYGQITMLTYEGEEGLLPEIFIGDTDPIVDPSLIITDFDDDFSQWGYWDGVAETGSDPELQLSGNYMQGLGSVSSWKWVWANNWITFPSVTKADHLFKIDVNITKPFGQDNAQFQMEFGGTRIDIGAFGMTSADETTEGWITVTYDLSLFDALPETIPGGGEWGINFNWAPGPVDISGLHLDNLRFEKK